MSDVEPLVFLAGVNKFGHDHPGWNLVGAPSKDGNRVCSLLVNFEQPFRVNPVVHVGLAGFDISNSDAARLKLRVVNISCYGFEVAAETWFDSQVWSIDVSWLAIGS